MPNIRKKKCLTALSNKARGFAANSENSTIDTSISPDSMALTELEACINEQIESIEIPVFQMPSLTKMYQERMRQLGSLKKAISTRLKKKLLDQFPP